MGVCKGFGTHITEKRPRQLVCIIVWSTRGSNRPKMPIFGQKCQFWAKFGGFWARDPFFYWRNQKFCYPHNGKLTWAPCSHCFLVGHWTKFAKKGNIWPKMTKNAYLWPNLGRIFGPFWAKKPRFYGGKQKFWYPYNRKTT